MRLITKTEMEHHTENKASADHHFDQLKFEFLSDDQLIRIIEFAREELDQRFPFADLQRLRCPKCGQTDDDFWIGCGFVATLTAEGAYVPMDTDDRPSWGAESGCRCPSCDHSGYIIDFLRIAKKGE